MTRLKQREVCCHKLSLNNHFVLLMSCTFWQQINNGEPLCILIKLDSHVIKIDADDYKKDTATGRITKQAKPFEGSRKDLPDKLSFQRSSDDAHQKCRCSMGIGLFCTLTRVVSSDKIVHHMLLCWG